MDIPKSLMTRLQEKWSRLAERTFGDAAGAGTQADVARGEFISDYIAESRLSFPPAGKTSKSSRTSVR